MKKIFVSALVLTMAVVASCANEENVQASDRSAVKLKSDDADKNMTDFVRNKVTVDFPRVLTNEYPKSEMSAKSFAVISYSDEFLPLTLLMVMSIMTK